MENLSEVPPHMVRRWQVVGTPEPRGPSLPTHAAHPVMQKASAPAARHDNTRTGGGTLRKNTSSRAAARAERLGHAECRPRGERGSAGAAEPGEHHQRSIGIN